MRQVTATGQTVEDAVRSALEQLNTSRDQVNVEVIDEGKKGFFGVFGAKKAIVKVMMVAAKEEPVETAPEQAKDPDEPQVDSLEIDDHTSSENESENKSLKMEEAIEATKEYLEQIGQQMGAPIQVSYKKKSKEIIFELEGDKIALLIGKRGQTLNALQSLAQLVINQDGRQYLTAIVDAEGYRERRKETLSGLAGRLADKAVRTKTEIALESMPSYERKIIHAALQHNKQVSTYSDGSEPHRHVVIKPE
ncbi:MULTISPECIES: RNA-binding cell elongation regulator Jag/EloR [Pontibacillus]|uniref:RNA-binding protein KhpB n=1 Tax=Pontibacillus chungwhensis TaxID=265426 RepID=A0ABY8UWT0_9BACI|nr:RNA-binding cell elongation regulator Jag/EloR [Pontibacillus chungwhensis]MCD5325616.1 protein jag [Pontibacillus sp. HN14]WIF98136.1 RNA-binding cell elongation regulator Jag/EloR [Pontibacillus chungwhensis]